METQTLIAFIYLVLYAGIYIAAYFAIGGLYSDPFSNSDESFEEIRSALEAMDARDNAEATRGSIWNHRNATLTDFSSQEIQIRDIITAH